MTDCSEGAMKEIVRETLFKATSSDLLTRQAAILEVALLIEKHLPDCDSQSYYQSMLPTGLLNISLSEEEQNELVHEIGRIILCDKVNGSLVWALTKSRSLDALEYLL